MKRIANIIDLIRNDIGHDTEAQALSLLAHFMTHDPNPLLIKELISLTGATQPSVIRYIRILGDNDDHPRGGECLGVLQVVSCSEDKRRKLITLSSKGRRLKKHLLEELNCI